MRDLPPYKGEGKKMKDDLGRAPPLEGGGMWAGMSPGFGRQYQKSKFIHNIKFDFLISGIFINRFSPPARVKNLTEVRERDMGFKEGQITLVTEISTKGNFIHMYEGRNS